MEESKPNLKSLPDHLICEITAYLAISDIGSLILTSKQIY